MSPHAFILTFSGHSCCPAFGSDPSNSNPKVRTGRFGTLWGPAGDLNLDQVVEQIWEELDLLRVYTKKKGSPPEFGQPSIMRRGVCPACALPILV